MTAPLPSLPRESSDALRRLLPENFDAALVLGSGLGNFTDSLRIRASLPSTAVPGYPVSRVAGHAGELVDAECEGMRVLVFRGRLHGYEGHAPEAAAMPARVAAELGIPRIILTNAAGGLHPDFRAGDLMLIRDLFVSPLARDMGGRRALPAGLPSPPRPLFREESLRRAREAAADAGVSLREGCYGFCSGPTYETRAEIAFFRFAGADAVGMSTAPEILFAAAAGMDVTAISCITNKAATVKTAVSHDEVTAVAARASGRLSSVLAALLRRTRG